MKQASAGREMSARRGDRSGLLRYTLYENGFHYAVLGTGEESVPAIACVIRKGGRSLFHRIRQLSK